MFLNISPGSDVNRLQSVFPSIYFKRSRRGIGISFLRHTKAFKYRVSENICAPCHVATVDEP